MKKTSILIIFFGLGFYGENIRPSGPPLPTPPTPKDSYFTFSQQDNRSKKFIKVLERNNKLEQKAFKKQQEQYFKKLVAIKGY